MSPDRLLEGENPQSMFARDARHWIGVYREMIVFKDDLLARVSAQVLKLPASAQSDVTENDIHPIEKQLGRYQRRIEYWYARQWELEGLQIDHGARTITYRERTVGLTRREFQLLIHLISRSPAFVSASQLLVQAWRDASLPEETLRTYVVRLRAKVADLGVPAAIHNRPRRGYALVFEDSDRAMGEGRVGVDGFGGQVSRDPDGHASVARQNGDVHLAASGHKPLRERSGT